jgi:hypothetical protein
MPKDHIIFCKNDGFLKNLGSTSISVPLKRRGKYTQSWQQQSTHKSKLEHGIIHL